MAKSLPSGFDRDQIEMICTEIPMLRSVYILLFFFVFFFFCVLKGLESILHIPNFEVDFCPVSDLSSLSWRGVYMGRLTPRQNLSEEVRQKAGGRTIVHR